ncbi:late embryogenesis abundant protein 1 [Salvia miltiorrhiza]|uniref:late embryogenesis abundant protein 1 n=1 Tax=Salvia miltiorrhiza TaxID=226208 RepID=UPI0025ACE58A|nr:late embryogenesis abundant protein 1 [Salvia miltiorrhiza]
MSNAYNAGQNRAQAQSTTEQWVDSAKQTASQVHDQAHEAVGHSQGQTQQRKEENATFLQQTAESVANTAQGAIDGVKNTLGMGDQKK